MLRLALLGLTCLGVAISCTGQLTIDWQRNYGGSSGESAECIAQTSDHGFIVLGRTSSDDGLIEGHHGMDDIWVLKLDSLGNVQWQRCLGGSAMETPGDVIQTMDGGYLIIGTTASDDGDVPPSLGSADMWLVKLDSAGELSWSRRYGGSGAEDGIGVHENGNGDILLFGRTLSPELNDYHGSGDVLLILVDMGGTPIVERCYGGSANDYPCSEFETEDDAYTFGAVSESPDGDCNCAAGSADAWIFRVDTDLDMTWSTCIGGSNVDNARGVFTATNGTVVVSITSYSSNGDVSGNHGEADYWIARLSEDGSLESEVNYGGSESDFPQPIFQDANGHILVGGWSSSMDGTVSDHIGATDAWILNLDQSLGLRWEMSIGGTQADFIKGMCSAPDGGLVLAGATASTDGGIPSLFGGPDLWVVKFNPEEVGIEEALDPDRLITYPNPASTEIFVTWKDFQAERLEVIDHLGQVCITVPAAGSRGTLAVPMASLASGLYVLQLTGTGGMRTARTLKH